MTTQEESAGTALAVQERREVRVVESANPVMSTAGFEHLMRVARLMAESGMMPKSLTHEGKGDNAKQLDNTVVLARAFLIAEQAARWDESPMVIMQCASLVHGKLMWEGKLVHAMLESKFGIKLSYQFGKWDAKTERVDLTKDGEGDSLGIVASGTVDGRIEEIHGCVGAWKTTGTGTPWVQGGMRRQLRYRSAREWSRAYRPSAILGITTDDEIEMETVVAQLPAPDKTLSGAHGDEQERPRTPARGRAAASTGDKAKAAQAQPEGRGDGPQREPEPDAGTKPAAAVAEPVSGDGTATGDGSPGTGEPTSAKADDGWQDYREAAEAGGPGPQRPTETASALSAAPDPDTSDSAAPASGASPDPTASGPSDSSPSSTESEEPSGEPDEPPPPVMIEYRAALTQAKTWPDFKTALHAVCGSPLFREGSAEDQDAILGAAWPFIEQRIEEGEAFPSHTKDPGMFRIWSVNQTDVTIVESAWCALAQSRAFTETNQKGRDTLVLDKQRVVAKIRSASDG